MLLLGFYFKIFLKYELTFFFICLCLKVKMGKLTDKEKSNALNEVRILASIK